LELKAKLPISEMSLILWFSRKTAYTNFFARRA